VNSIKNQQINMHYNTTTSTKYAACINMNHNNNKTIYGGAILVIFASVLFNR
jgi:hypothetical protein